jgi:hypothetical protein
VGELLATVAVLVGQVASLAATVERLANGRDAGAMPAANPATDREEERRKEGSHREAIDTSSLSPRTVATVGATDREHIDALLDRLLSHRRVDRRHLTARAPLHAALAAHPREHREHAIDRLLADLDAGRGGITNVFGCLHHKATSGDPDYFCSPPPPRSAPPLPMEAPQAIDHEALDAVRSMGPVERAALSESTEARARAAPWFRESLFERVREYEPGWERELAEEWRRQRQAIAS